MNNNFKEYKSSRYPLNLSFNLLLIGWTIVMIGIVFWSYKTTYSELIDLAYNEAYTGYEKDVMFRTWAAMHGGVYVPITENTQPNPYLSHMPERDITTPSNKKLTLMNPAYITRQVHELSLEKTGLRGHLTSLNPIRKENAADNWEKAALLTFEKGALEARGFDTINNEKYFRYMAPQITEESCLKCHSIQGYKLGEVRGGISSSVPWGKYQRSLNSQAFGIFTSYGILWIIGFIGISVVKKKFIIYLKNRDEHEEEMHLLNEELAVSKNLIEENLYNQNQLVEELSDSKEKLQELNLIKDKFFSIIAHDLKSPFQGFLGITDMLAEDLNNFTKEELSDSFLELNKNSKNLYKLIENLLDWAQMQKGDIIFDPIEFPLSEIIHQNIAIAEIKAEQKGIKIIYELPIEENVFADKKMTETVLRNLLSNAVKYSTKGGQIFVNAEKIDNEMVRISIRDAGIGMSQSIINKLFKIDERTGRNGTDGETSTGLGLILCKEFVELNGGEIWAESKENVGSTFYFTLKSKI